MIETQYKPQGEPVQDFDYFTKTMGRDGGITLHGWGHYGRSSVLAGQAAKIFVDFFDSEEELNLELIDSGINPDDVKWSNKWIEPHISVNHLPDEGDW